MGERPASKKRKISIMPEAEEEPIGISIEEVLPEEILYRILAFCSPRDLQTTAVLNKQFQVRATDRSFWRRFCAEKLQVPSIIDVDAIDWKSALWELGSVKLDCKHALLSRVNTARGLADDVDVAPDNLTISTTYIGKNWSNRAVPTQIPFTPGPKSPFFALRAKRAPNSSGEEAVEYFPVMTSVSYYEITIHSMKKDDETSEQVQMRRREDECIAIGLADARFPANGQMPGWSLYSIGYHSDDGGLFFQSRRLPYGPKFGERDVIGCGIDHAKDYLFFTHNGKFLGVAFKNLPKRTQLFPTVGFDTNHPVELNFGVKPFTFDPESVLSPSFDGSSEAKLACATRLPSALNELFGDLEASDDEGDVDADGDGNDIVNRLTTVAARLSNRLRHFTDLASGYTLAAAAQNDGEPNDNAAGQQPIGEIDWSFSSGEGSDDGSYHSDSYPYSSGSGSDEDFEFMLRDAPSE